MILLGILLLKHLTKDCFIGKKNSRAQGLSGPQDPELLFFLDTCLFEDYWKFFNKKSNTVNFILNTP